MFFHRKENVFCGRKKSETTTTLVTTIIIKNKYRERNENKKTQNKTRGKKTYKQVKEKQQQQHRDKYLGAIFSVNSVNLEKKNWLLKINNRSTTPDHPLKIEETIVEKQNWNKNETFAHWTLTEEFTESFERSSNDYNYHLHHRLISTIRHTHPHTHKNIKKALLHTSIHIYLQQCNDGVTSSIQ